MSRMLDDAWYARSADAHVDSDYAPGKVKVTKMDPKELQKITDEKLAHRKREKLPRCDEAVKIVKTGKEHRVKLLEKYFSDVALGQKEFELRKDDRDYHVGDTVRLCEFDGKRTTGEEILFRIKYKLKDVDGLINGYCILGLTTHGAQ